MKLSVVIPTMGRPILVQTVESVLDAEGGHDVELIVAGRIRNDEVQRQLDAIRAEHGNVKHLPVAFEKGDSSEKKNVGAREAGGDIIAFLDDDVVVAPDWPLRITEPFKDPDVGLVSGPSLVPDDINVMARLAGVSLQSKAAGYVSERYLQGSSEARSVGWSRTIGCNMAYRREAFEFMGGFDPYFWPGEEMYAAYKAGQRYQIRFYPLAYVHHYPRESFRKFWRQMHGYGATRTRLIRAGTEFESATIVPGVWVASLAVLIPLSLLHKLFGWLLLLDIVLYLAVDALIAIHKYRETRRAVDLLIFFLIPVMHLSYGIAEWVEFVRPGKDFSEA
jgi:cellulose synthase/poly-beta-1,6-N-acetylglucosamine synthase-like glycosyltransferase